MYVRPEDASIHLTLMQNDLPAQYFFNQAVLASAGCRNQFQSARGGICAEKLTNSYGLIITSEVFNLK